MHLKLFCRVNFEGQDSASQKESCTKIGNGVLGHFGGGLTSFSGVLTSKNGVLKFSECATGCN